MGYFYDTIPDHCMDWIREQHMFHVATAPMKRNGHVNVSPKGLDTFELVDEKTCWYQDLSGSGNETISHIYENGRLTIMFQAFVGPPRILRLYGKGTVFERGSFEFASFLPEGDPRLQPGARSIIKLDIRKVGLSCGYAVPFMEYVGERDILIKSCLKAEDRDRATSHESFYLQAQPSPESKSSSPKNPPTAPSVPIIQETHAPPKGGFLYAMAHFNVISMDGLGGLKFLRGGEVSKRWGIQWDMKGTKETNSRSRLREAFEGNMEVQIWIAFIFGFLGCLVGIMLCLIVPPTFSAFRMLSVAL